MKILITGASGYVGAKIYNDLKTSKYDVTGTYHTNKLFEELIKVDLTNQSEVDTLIANSKPSIIIHAGADAHTDTCEKNPEYANKINVDSTRYIATLATQNNIKVIHLSTFACFNKDSSKVYNKTKIEAERIIEKLTNYVILRMSIVVGVSPNKTSKNFYNDLIKAYQIGNSFDADSSWNFEMSYLGSISKVIKHVIENDNIKNVMIPYAEKGITSRYKIAKDVLADKQIKVNELNSNRILPIPEVDTNLLDKLGINRSMYKTCVEDMKNELASL